MLMLLITFLYFENILYINYLYFTNISLNRSNSKDIDRDIDMKSKKKFENIFKFLNWSLNNLCMYNCNVRNERGSEEKLKL